MASDEDAKNSLSPLPAILRGREGEMNGSIIRYLALNGPSLIYSVSKYLADNSETKIHYPTVNRRMHDLLNQKYLEKAGSRNTKAGTLAALFATTIRGDFVAIADIFHENPKKRSSEMSPKETRQLIKAAACRRGSPFVLLRIILEDSQNGQAFLSRVLLPEIIKGIRNGYLNLEALEDGVICSAFASLVARTVIEANSRSETGSLDGGSQTEIKQFVQVLLSSLDKTLFSSHEIPKKQGTTESELGTNNVLDSIRADRGVLYLTPIPIQWAKELKVFLRLNSIKFG